MFKTLIAALSLLLLCGPSEAFADADGPDFFQVIGVKADDVLNIRSGPAASHTKIGEIPANSDGVQNLGCEGGLSFAEWSEATEEERLEGTKRRWCQIEYKDLRGWVAGRFLAEGHESAGTISPSFECARASNVAAEAVCATPLLARLDLELARLYKLAAESPKTGPERLTDLKATQRGWIKGRNECWKVSNVLNDCIAESYVMRIDDIRTGYAGSRANDGSGISDGPLAYFCDGLDAVVSLVVVNADPSMLSLRWIENWVVPTLQPSASGARYQQKSAGGTYSFWMKGSQALFEINGQPEVTCEQEEVG